MKSLRGYLSGANEQSGWFNIPVASVDYSGIRLDTEAPKIESVQFRRATNREIRAWNRANR